MTTGAGLTDPSALTTDQIRREVDHLRDRLTDGLAAARDLTDARLADLDLRLQQRFEAQSKALDAALSASSGTNTRLGASLTELDRTIQAMMSRGEIDASLQRLIDLVGTTREAVEDKMAAQTAAQEKQREIITDQVSVNTMSIERSAADARHSYLPRTEATAQYAAITDRMAADAGAAGDARTTLTERISTLDARLSSRLDLAAGRGAGLSSAWGYGLAALGALATLLGIYNTTKGG